MALTHKTFTHKPRPWGYEIPMEIIDTETGKIYGIVMCFPDQPKDQKEIDNRIEHEKQKIQDQIDNPPEPVQMVDMETIEEELRQKGYLKEGEKFEDLPTLEAK